MFKKIIAPLIITILTCAFMIFYFVMVLLMPNESFMIPFKIIIGVILIAFLSASIWALCSRIKEIKKGEEDDISKY